MYHPYSHSPSALTEYLKHRLRLQRAKRLGRSPTAQVEPTVQLERNTGNKTQYWRKYFVPSLIAWAGSQPDPFGTNYGVGTEAALVWGQVFPAIELTPKDCDTLSGVVSNLFHLTTLGYWR